MKEEEWELPAAGFCQSEKANLKEGTWQREADVRDKKGKRKTLV